MNTIVNHHYHPVNSSPWPIINSIGITALILSLVNWIYTNSIILIMIALITIMIMSIQWWRNVIWESTAQSLRTNQVALGLNQN